MKKQPTKRQIQIVENFIKSETKRLMKENAQYDQQLEKLSKGSESLKKIGDAYSDDWSNVGYSKRNLDFKGDFLNVKDFLYAVQTFIPNGYNEFDFHVASRVVRLFGMNAKYSLSREGSVAVYVQTPDIKKFKNGEKYRRQIAADEFSIEGNEIRIWWD